MTNLCDLNCVLICVKLKKVLYVAYLEAPTRPENGYYCAYYSFHKACQVKLLNN